MSYIMFALPPLKYCSLPAGTRPNNCPALSFTHGPIYSLEGRSSAVRITETINVGIGDAYDIGGACRGGVLEPQKPSDHLGGKAAARRSRRGCDTEQLLRPPAVDSTSICEEDGV